MGGLEGFGEDSSSEIIYVLYGYFQERYHRGFQSKEKAKYPEVSYLILFLLQVQFYR